MADEGKPNTPAAPLKADPRPKLESTKPALLEVWERIAENRRAAVRHIAELEEAHASCDLPPDHIVTLLGLSLEEAAEMARRAREALAEADRRVEEFTQHRAKDRGVTLKELQRFAGGEQSSKVEAIKSVRDWLRAKRNGQDDRELAWAAVSRTWSLCYRSGTHGIEIDAGVALLRAVYEQVNREDSALPGEQKAREIVENLESRLPEIIFEGEGAGPRGRTTFPDDP